MQQPVFPFVNLRAIFRVTGQVGVYRVKQTDYLDALSWEIITFNLAF